MRRPVGRRVEGTMVVPIELLIFVDGALAGRALGGGQPIPDVVSAGGHPLSTASLSARSASMSAANPVGAGPGASA